MKTPEEIKKGLECCGNDMFLCPDECPYIGSAREGSGCAVNMSKDALAYIQQLEAQNAELMKELNQLQWELESAEEALCAEYGGERVKTEEWVRCADCEHLMFSDCYGECSKGHKGLVNPDDTCPHGVRRDKNH